MSAPLLWGNGLATNLQAGEVFTDPATGLAGSSIQTGSVNPTSVATAGNPGSLYLNDVTGQMYRKLDSGTTTNWSLTVNSTTLPTVQTFLSGSGTYTTPVGALYIKVTMAGGGGGGGGAAASGAAAGGTGGTTTFGSILTASGGVGGNPTGFVQGGAGGTNTISGGTTLLSLVGGPGDGAANVANASGGPGGTNALGGAGGGGGGNGLVGIAAASNTGAGGGGAGAAGSYGSGSGGGAGGYIQSFIIGPAASYSYAVGAAGSAGTGTSAGGAGGSGIIIVEEYYGIQSSATTAQVSYAQAYASGTPVWSTTATSPADFSLSSGTNAITVRRSNNITLTAAASNLPGITFTPASSSAVYLITAQVLNYNSSASAGMVLDLTDGTTVITSSPGAGSSNASTIAYTSTTLSGVYVPGTSSPVTVKVQGATASGGTAYIQQANVYSSPIEWTVTRIDSLSVTSTGGSGITRSVNVISSPTTAGATSSTDYVYLVSGTTTLTLPTAVGNTNLYTVKNTGVNTVSIATTSSQTIDGSTAPITLPVANTSLDLISDGSNWSII